MTEIFNDEIVVLEPKAQKYLATAAAAISEGGHILEFGTFCGGSASIMAKANPKVNVHTVDPDDFSWMNDSSKYNPFVLWLETNWGKYKWSGETVLNLRKSVLEKYRNILFYKGYSRGVKIPTRFDMCFIDGDHHTLEIVADFWHCWALTKPGGLIIGDDLIFDPIKEAVEIIERGLGFSVQKMPEINMFCVRKTKDPAY